MYHCHLYSVHRCTHVSDRTTRSPVNHCCRNKVSGFSTSDSYSTQLCKSSHISLYLASASELPHQFSHKKVFSHSNLSLRALPHKDHCGCSPVIQRCSTLHLLYDKFICSTTVIIIMITVKLT